MSIILKTVGLERCRSRTYFLVGMRYKGDRGTGPLGGKPHHMPQESSRVFDVPGVRGIPDGDNKYRSPYEDHWNTCGFPIWKGFVRDMEFVFTKNNNVFSCFLIAQAHSAVIDGNVFRVRRAWSF